MRALLATLCLFAFGCVQPGASSDAGTPYFDKQIVRSTHIVGSAWDPEAYFFGLASCGMNCPIPPLTAPGVPFFEGSVIAGANVSVIDVITGMPDAVAATTGPDGVWQVQNVTTRANPPMFTFNTHDPASLNGKPALQPFGPPFLPAVPPGNYLPTFSLRPINTAWSQCLAQVAELVSTTGILQAVAKYRISKGMNTQVSDFSNPQKFGGVVVWWMYLPAGSPAQIPAYATRMTANVGQVLNIAWAPPGTKGATQSARGFYVDDGAPLSAIGATVTLLPTTSAPVTNVQFAGVDDITDAMSGRPWKFPPLPPVPVAPGVSFGQLPGILDGAPAPSKWVCLPGY
jgi:hypothetical protein